MAVKVFIRRNVPEDKAKEVIPVFRELRRLAMEQKGYISGETMRKLDRPTEYLVISTWQTSEDWRKWLASSEREALQGKLDGLLGGKTEYDIYHYGFAE
jgi:heme-degrading monooxygenase HmoA